MQFSEIEICICYYSVNRMKALSSYTTSCCKIRKPAITLKCQRQRAVSVWCSWVQKPVNRKSTEKRIRVKGRMKVWER